MNMPDVAARWLSHPGPSPVPDTVLDPEASALRGLTVTGKRQEGSCSERRMRQQGTRVQLDCRGAASHSDS